MKLPPIITVKQAKKQGMEPLTTTMHSDDHHLFRICKDMAKIVGTQWALVHEGMNRIAVWRVPKVPFIKED